MADNEFSKLEKAEQEVLAQIAQQKSVCENLRTEFQALRDDFLGSYDTVFRPLQASLKRLEGDEWTERRDGLNSTITYCSASIKDTDTSEDIGKLQSSLKVRIKEALIESDSTVNQFEEMSTSLRKLEALVLGRDSEDFLEELQSKKQRLEKEEERLKSLQDRYDHYFGDRGPKKDVSD